MERIQEQMVEPIEVLPHKLVQQHTAKQIMHVPVPQIREQSAVTGLATSQFLVTTVEVVDSFSVSEEFAAFAEMTTLNTSSTSTRSSAPVCNREETTQSPVEISSSSSTSISSDRRLDEFASTLDSCIKLLTPVTAEIDSIEKASERASMLTKRMMETPLPEPPMVEPPLVEPPMVESDLASCSREGS